MTLLSVLRNGDTRFLPLLLAKVSDVLPTLANPMLQSVPDTPTTICAPEIDIFEGYPPVMVPSNYMPNSSPSDYNMSQPALKLESQYENKRIEEIASPIHGPESGEGSPFTSPPIITQGMEFPGMGEYAPFPDLASNNFDSSRRVDFKREFEGNLGMANVRRPPPLRQNSSNSSFALQSPGGMQIPRSVPGFEHHPQLQRTTSRESEMGMAGEMPFRWWELW
jgi:hypothetical protein